MTMTMSIPLEGRPLSSTGPLLTPAAGDVFEMMMIVTVTMTTSTNNDVLERRVMLVGG